MADTDPFFVCRTAEIPPDVIDRFLTVTYARSEELAPGIGPCLAVLPGRNGGDDSGNDTGATTASGAAADLAPSPFIGLSAPEVAERLGDPRNRYFAVMDSRSAEDDTVLLVKTASQGESEGEGEGGAVQTVRATFTSAQSVLVSLRIGTLGFEEVQDDAADSPRGVYDLEDEDDDGPSLGEPAPPKLLGDPGN